MQHGFVCYTRSFDFAIFLGSLRISIFTLLRGIEDERGYPEILSLFKFDGADRLRCDVHQNSIDTFDLVSDAVGDMVEQGVRDLLNSC